MSQQPLVVRPYQDSDLDEMARIELECWGASAALNRIQLEESMRVFPEGTLIVTSHEGTMLAFVTTLRTKTYDLDHEVPTTWYEATDSGMLRGAYDPDGQSLYGVNLTRAKRREAFMTGGIAIEAAMDLVVKLGCRNLVAGARMPNYCTWKQVMRAEDFARVLRGGDGLYYRDATGQLFYGGPGGEIRRRSRETKQLADLDTWVPVPDRVSGRERKLVPLDPQLRFYYSCRAHETGFRFGRVLPDYFEDPNSDNYGVLLVWENPFWEVSDGTGNHRSPTAPWAA